MQSLITWSQLFVYLMIFLPIYYAAVLAVCYRREVLKLASRFYHPEELQLEEADDNEQKGYVSGSQSDKNMYDTVLQLMQEWKGIFNNVTNAPIHKGRLIEDLASMARKYPSIKGSSFQISLSNHVQQEADYRLGLKLTDEELEAIWK